MLWISDFFCQKLAKNRFFPHKFSDQEIWFLNHVISVRICICSISMFCWFSLYVFIILMLHTMFAIYLFGFGKQIFAFVAIRLFFLMSPSLYSYLYRSHYDRVNFLTRAFMCISVCTCVQEWERREKIKIRKMNERKGLDANETTSVACLIVAESGLYIRWNRLVHTHTKLEIFSFSLVYLSKSHPAFLISIFRSYRERESTSIYGVVLHSNTYTLCNVYICERAHCSNYNELNRLFMLVFLLLQVNSG